MIKRKKMRGTVQKIIKPIVHDEPEKAEIQINEADDLYKEIRIQNEVTDDAGQKAQLKEGADVSIIVEADSSAAPRKP
jgi:molybdopterin-binding protein